MTSSGEIVGVLTNFGQIIPVKRGKYDGLKYPLIDINFYPDADKYISKSVELINREEKWSNSRKDDYENVFIIKKELGKKISNDENMKNEITNIIKNEKITKFRKIELLNNIFKKIVSPLSTSIKFTEVELSDIANEVINDNVENLLINNVVMEHSYNKNEIKSRDTESIWLNINDITNWFKKYESDEKN